MSNPGQSKAHNPKALIKHKITEEKNDCSMRLFIEPGESRNV